MYMGSYDDNTYNLETALPAICLLREELAENMKKVTSPPNKLLQNKQTVSL